MIEITLDSQQHIKGLTEEEIAEIREELTFPNPLYLQTVKYSRYATTRVPKELYYFSYNDGILTVPLGYVFKGVSDVRYTDTRFTGEKLKLDHFLLKLRPSQIEAKDAFLNQNMNYDRNGVIQMGTGKGKSILSLAIAYELKLKTLIVVHKDDLVVGWTHDIKDCFGEKVDIGIIKASKRNVGKFLTVATFQTLNRLPEDELCKLYQTFGLVIHDECHGCASNYFSITSNFNSRYKIGLSATPERNDGLTHIIELYFGGKCYISEYIEETEEDILPVDVIVRNIKGVYFDTLFRVSYKKNTKMITKVTQLVSDVYYDKDYKPKDNEKFLSELPNNKKPRFTYHDMEDHVLLNQEFGDTVMNDVMKEYQDGRSIVIFINKKEHCEIYYECLYELVGDKVQLFYGDSKESNEELMRRAEEREALITITTIKKGTEGTNVRAWEVAFLVSSMNNGKGVEQAVGRIRRVKEGKISPCCVYDYRTPNVYMTAHHGKTRDTRYKQMKCKIINENGGRKLFR